MQWWPRGVRHRRDVFQGRPATCWIYLEKRGDTLPRSKNKLTCWAVSARAWKEANGDVLWSRRNKDQYLLIFLKWDAEKNGSDVTPKKPLHSMYVKMTESVHAISLREVQEAMGLDAAVEVELFDELNTKTIDSLLFGPQEIWTRLLRQVILLVQIRHAEGTSFSSSLSRPQTQSERTSI